MTLTRVMLQPNYHFWKFTHPNENSLTQMTTQNGKLKIQSPSENSVTPMTTQNGKLKIHSLKWKFTHPNEDSITQPPNDNSKWQIENSLTQSKIQSLKIFPFSKHFQRQIFKLTILTFAIKFLTILKIKLKIHPNENSTKFLYTPEKIPRDNTARPHEILAKQILFSTSKWKFDQENTHLLKVPVSIKCLYRLNLLNCML